MQYADFEHLIMAAERVQGNMPLSARVLAAGEVGAALLTEGGNIYTGVSVHLACGIGFCAEHAAVAEMLKAREVVIRAVVAISEVGVLAPCGRCRELLMQLSRQNADCQVLLPDHWVEPLRDLLPEFWIE